MKKRIFALSAALFAVMLSGCGNVEPPSAPEFSEPMRIMPIESSRESSSGSGESAVESSADSSDESSVPEYPIQNEGKYVKTTRCYNGEGKLTSVSTETFDEHDNIIVSYYGVEKHYYAYEYNADGTVAGKYAEDRHTVYEYENGMQTKETEYRNGKPSLVITREYDEHGNVTFSSYENPDIDSFYEYFYEYEYDENGQWISQTGFRSYHGEPREEFAAAACVRDEKGNIISGVLDDGSRKVYENKYDESGNRTEHHYVRELKNGDISEKRTVAEYDGQGREIRSLNYLIENGAETLRVREEYEYTAVL